MLTFIHILCTKKRKKQEEKNMAFCMYCGKQLEDGEICSCQSGGNSMEIPTENPTEIPM